MVSIAVRFTAGSKNLRNEENNERAPASAVYPCVSAILSTSVVSPRTKHAPATLPATSRLSSTSLPIKAQPGAFESSISPPVRLYRHRATRKFSSAPSQGVHCRRTHESGRSHPHYELRSTARCCTPKASSRVLVSSASGTSPWGPHQPQRHVASQLRPQRSQRPRQRPTAPDPLAGYRPRHRSAPASSRSRQHHQSTTVLFQP